MAKTSTSRKTHQLKTGVQRGGSDSERKPRPASMGRGPGQVEPFRDGEKDYEPNPAPPKRFND